MIMYLRYFGNEEITGYSQCTQEIIDCIVPHFGQWYLCACTYRSDVCGLHTTALRTCKNNGLAQIFQ